MSNDLAAVWEAIKTRAADQITLLPMYWPREPNEFPDTPSAFVYFDLTVDRTRAPVAFGGGRGSNLYRYSAELTGFLMVPRNFTVEKEAVLAEHIAVAFRSYRDAVISCFAATTSPAGEGEKLVPPGVHSAADQYNCTAVSIALTFDQVG